MEAAAIDAAGNRAEAQLTLTVDQAAAGPGYLRGEVYDDSRGLLLDQAAVSVRADGAEIAAAVTGADGAYFFELPAGSYLVVLSRAGYTSVERTVTVQPALNLQLRDARLTPVSGRWSASTAPAGRCARPSARAPTDRPWSWNSPPPSSPTPSTCVCCR